MSNDLIKQAEKWLDGEDGSIFAIASASKIITALIKRVKELETQFAIYKYRHYGEEDCNVCHDRDSVSEQLEAKLSRSEAIVAACLEVVRKEEGHE